MEEINDILAKHFSSTELSVEEKTKLNNWKIDNLAEFESLAKSWQTVPKFEYKEFDTQTAWQKIDHKIVKKELKTTKVFSIKPFLKYAVAASIILIVTIGGFNLFGNSATNGYVAFENNTNTVKTLHLEDGSVIYLGGQTTIEYQNEFASHRNIKLNGEAFFEVHRDEQHPFIITTTYGEIEVLGTSFNINTQNKNTVVSVKTGRVELRNDLETIILIKNESAISNGKVITPKTTVNANYLSWKTGELIFKNTPIAEVINSLNSFYHTNITIEKSVNPNQNFTGQFNNQKLDVILEALTLSCNLNYIKTDNQISNN